MPVSQGYRSGIGEQGAGTRAACISQSSAQPATRLNRGGIFALKKEVSTMLQVYILDRCQYCDGQAYVYIGEFVDEIVEA